MWMSSRRLPLTARNWMIVKMLNQHFSLVTISEWVGAEWSEVVVVSVTTDTWWFGSFQSANARGIVKCCAIFLLGSTWVFISDSDVDVVAYGCDCVVFWRGGDRSRKSSDGSLEAWIFFSAAKKLCGRYDSLFCMFYKKRDKQRLLSWSWKNKEKNFTRNWLTMQNITSEEGSSNHLNW